MMQAVRIKIHGKVQGVWFRKNTYKTAKELGIKGFVRNEPDGSVYIEAEGNESNLKMFIEWCKEGPESAIVKSVEFDEQEFKQFQEFIIR
jgi:acylphosphatase